jgi:hypothetical protein
MANHVLIQRLELSQTTATVTFANIPQTGFTDLRIVISGRSVDSSAYSGIGIRMNNDSTAAYNRKQIEGGDANVASYTASSTTDLGGWYTPAGNMTANTYGSVIIDIPEYATTKYKIVNGLTAGEGNQASSVYMDVVSGYWSSNAAIHTLSFLMGSTSFATGTSISLYGRAAFGVTTVQAKAYGGDIVVNDGTYWYHAFESSGTFTATQGITCDYLVVAGGGGAGGYGSGGGGAGGFRTATSQALTAGNYAVVVGAGGAAGYNTTAGFSGSISSFRTTESAGGGGTGYGGTGIQSGGSGGGGFGGLSGPKGANGGGFGNTPSTSPSQGNDGGDGSPSASNYGTGGGGGAGAVGGNGTGSAGGNGGIGSSTAISGGSATGLGQLSSSTYYFAGGGGGATTFGGTGGTGGIGGGGNGKSGSANTNGDSGTANTGGGGGGGSVLNAPGSARGGAGGSGIVIIRYPMA